MSQFALAMSNVEDLLSFVSFVGFTLLASERTWVNSVLRMFVGNLQVVHEAYLPLVDLMVFKGVTVFILELCNATDTRFRHFHWFERTQAWWSTKLNRALKHSYGIT